MPTVRIVLNHHTGTYRPYTTTDEATIRSFGGYDHDDPTDWTRDQWRTFAQQSGLRILTNS